MEQHRIRKNGQMDFALFITIILISAFGLVMVFSASYYYAQNAHNDGIFYIKRQLMYFGLGLAAILVLSNIDYLVGKRLKH